MSGMFWLELRVGVSWSACWVERVGARLQVFARIFKFASIFGLGVAVDCNEL